MLHRGMFVVDTDVECARANAANCSRHLAALPTQTVHFKATVYYEDAADDTVPLLLFTIAGPSEYDAMECAPGAEGASARAI